MSDQHELQLVPDDLRARLKRCIDIRHRENSMTPAMREILESKDHPEKPDCLRVIMDQFSGALCMCDLGGIEPETMIRGWVELMERKHSRAN